MAVWTFRSTSSWLPLSIPDAPSHYRLLLQPRELLPLGEFHAKISLHVTLPDGQTIVTKSIKVQGEIIEDVEASPSAVLFPSCPIGEQRTQTILLRSLTAKPFTIREINVTGEGLSIGKGEPSPGGAIAFQVTQRVIHEGKALGKVCFRVLTAGQERDLEIVVSCYGEKTP